MKNNKFTVQSASMCVTVEAKNHKMAAIKAIDENNPESLGTLISVLKENDSEDNETFFLSESILNDMGFEVEK